MDGYDLMYVCQNMNHDGDARIPVTASSYQVGDQTYCVDCWVRIITPAPKVLFVDPIREGRGLNAHEQGYLL